MHDRKFRFGVMCSHAASAAEFRDRARMAEALGYSTLFVPDHFIDHPLAPVPAMATASAVTDTLRIGSLVLGNDYKHPVVLAREAATLDLLSDGRLELGLGAGWMTADYDKAGLELDRPGVRIDRLEESIAVLKGLMGDGPFTFQGKHYAVTDLDGHPKPVQRPHPPFLIGGGGRRTLELAAREAQIVGLAPRILPGRGGDPASITWEGTREKIGWVLEAAGNRFEELELNVYPSMAAVSVTDDPLAEARELADQLEERSGVRVPAEELLESPHIFINTVDGFVAKFRRMRDELGISSIMVGSPGELDPVVERLAGT